MTIVHPIQAPMVIMPRNAMSTTKATAQNLRAFRGNVSPITVMSSCGANRMAIYPTAMTVQVRNIAAPIVWSLLMVFTLAFFVKVFDNKDL